MQSIAFNQTSTEMPTSPLCGTIVPLDASPSALATPIASRQLSLEIAKLPQAQYLYTSGNYHVLVARSHQIPLAMLELGRLREESFRQVGEGTGNSRDLDRYDQWYEHLFVWNWAESQIVGAYRLARTDAVTPALGAKGLYSRSLFGFDERFLRRLGPAIELGRSFVRAEYQGMGRVLALLWRGIGRYIARYPECRSLLGPVSISSTYSSSARQHIASELMKCPHRHSLSELIQPLRPLPPAEIGYATPAVSVKQVSKTVAQLDPSGRGLPVLVSEYLKLGGRFCGFSVDPDFGNALDGLVVVDLDETKPRLLSLYMGADNYLNYKSCALRQWAS